MKTEPVHISTVIEFIFSNHTINSKAMRQGQDESTINNTYGNDDNEYGYLPSIGTFKKGNIKKIFPSNEDNVKRRDSITFSESESYHDKTGKLCTRRVRFYFDEDGKRVYLPVED